MSCENEKCKAFDLDFEDHCERHQNPAIDCDHFFEDPAQIEVTPAQRPTAPKNHAKEGKPRPSLLPMDVLITHVCPAYEEGVLKYVRESWRQGFHVSVLFDAAQRHMNDFFYKGEDYDPDAAKLGIRKHHLAGAIFSLLCILQTLDTRPELDDRYIPEPETEINNL